VFLHVPSLNIQAMGYFQPSHSAVFPHVLQTTKFCRTTVWATVVDPSQVWSVTVITSRSRTGFTPNLLCASLDKCEPVFRRLRTKYITAPSIQIHVPVHETHGDKVRKTREPHVLFSPLSLRKETEPGVEPPTS
jgi:hypothetical protein